MGFKDNWKGRLRVFTFYGARRHSNEDIYLGFMDLVKLIQQKVSYFKDTKYFSGLTAVVDHIKSSVLHLENGKKNGDDYLFNDVIYRTNQAFEGSLKEAYAILTGNESSSKTPNQIEKYFEEKGILKERVLKLFINYRQEWRNKSTHDYKLLFTAQESFLAIVSISAFSNILLDQMIEKAAYDKERENAEKKPSKPAGYEKLSLGDQIAYWLAQVSRDVQKQILSKRGDVSEYEISGIIAGYINSADEKIKMLMEPFLDVGDGLQMRPDFVMKKGSDTVVVEIKRYSREIGRRKREGRERLLRYLEATGTNTGILYMPPTGSETEVVVESETIDSFEKVIQMLFVIPKG